MSENELEQLEAKIDWLTAIVREHISEQTVWNEKAVFAMQTGYEVNRDAIEEIDARLEELNR